MTETEARELMALQDPHEECAEYGNPRRACDGEIVHYRSSGGSPSTRCTAHYEDLQARLEGIREDYPDSPFAPDWFDASYAGEQWNDDYWSLD